MGVTIKKTNNIPKLTKALKKLDKKEIQVGVFGEDSNVDYGDANLVTIARVHEFGMTIKPKNAQYLTIPLIKEAKGKRAREFADLFPVGLEDGSGALVRDKGNGQLEAVFALVKSVTIPERSFLRTGYDENVDKIVDKIEEHLNDVLEFKINPDVFADMIGLEFAGMIQRHMKKIKSPGNAPATKAVKGSGNPLQDTGRLIGSIRHKVK